MQRESGILYAWFDDKGYGFIHPARGGRDVFLHARDIALHQRRPRQHDQVSYILQDSQTEKPLATDARICGFAWSFITLLTASALPFLLAYAVAIQQHWVKAQPLVFLYVGASLLTVAVYHHDKRAAQLGARRVSELNLHLLELAGGWPGALLAQLFFRHKCRKVAYQSVFCLIVLTHAAALVLYAYRDALPRATDGALSRLLLRADGLFVAWASKVDSAVAAPQPTPPEAAPPETAPPDAVAPLPPELAPGEWTHVPSPQPLLRDPGTPRAQIPAPPGNRRLVGLVTAVCPLRGVRVELPPDIGGEGVIAAHTLVSDYHRRFEINERVTVTITGIRMIGRARHVDLLLVE